MHNYPGYFCILDKIQREEQRLNLQNLQITDEGKLCGGYMATCYRSGIIKTSNFTARGLHDLCKKKV